MGSGAEEAKKAEARRLAEERKAELLAKKKGEPRLAYATPAGQGGAIKVAAAVARKGFGTIIVKTTPPAQLRYNGRPLSGIKVDLVGPTGTIEVFGPDAPFKVRISQTGEKVGLASDPWAIARINGQPAGKTPLENLAVGEELTRIELKNPKVEQPMQLVLRWSRQAP